GSAGPPPAAHRNPHAERQPALHSDAPRPSARAADSGGRRPVARWPDSSLHRRQPASARNPVDESLPFHHESD
ncbi:hypothetical protein, partial [Burkholderia vietnamiensis]|uniref:hypothetical protein n=2 Tax=Burkholderia vietnamiensis TaxID=60552 RepID=UPI001CF1D6F1